MKLVFLPVLLAMLGQGGDSAAIMKATEENIAKAKSFQVTFNGKIDRGKDKGTLRGVVSVGPDNKVRVEANVDFMDKKLTFEVISDGSKIVTIVDGKSVDSEDAPKNLHTYMTVVATRIGPTAMFLLRVQGLGRKVPDPLELAKLSDLKMLKSEKIGDREAAVIACTLTVKDHPPAFTGSVWIDSKTNLPLKRVLSAEKGEERISITETYSNWRINPQLDAKLFELPK